MAHSTRCPGTGKGLPFVDLTAPDCFLASQHRALGRQSIFFQTCIQCVKSSSYVLFFIQNSVKAKCCRPREVALNLGSKSNFPYYKFFFTKLCVYQFMCIFLGERGEVAKASGIRRNHLFTERMRQAKSWEKLFMGVTRHH